MLLVLANLLCKFVCKGRWPFVGALARQSCERAAATHTCTHTYRHTHTQTHARTHIQQCTADHGAGSAADMPSCQDLELGWQQGEASQFL